MSIDNECENLVLKSKYELDSGEIFAAYLSKEPYALDLLKVFLHIPDSHKRLLLSIAQCIDVTTSLQSENARYNQLGDFPDSDLTLEIGMAINQRASGGSMPCSARA